MTTQTTCIVIVEAIYNNTAPLDSLNGNKQEEKEEKFDPSTSLNGDWKTSRLDHLLRPIDTSFLYENEVRRGCSTRLRPFDPIST